MWSAIALKISSICNRARFAPRQKWAPLPPKPEVRVGTAGDVEPLRVVEDLFVEVGRAVEDAHPLPGPDLLAAQLGVHERGALEGDRPASPSGRSRRRPSAGARPCTAPTGRGGRGRRSMPWVIELRVVSLPATASRSTKNPNSSGVSCSPSISAVHELGHDVVPRAQRGVPRPCSCCTPSISAAAISGCTSYSGSSYADHLVGPVEDLVPVLLRHAEQLGDRLEGQLAGDVGDEVAAAPVQRRLARSCSARVGQRLAQAARSPGG